VSSTLARQADVALDVGVGEEACPMNLAPTSSTTAALAMGDALAMALLDLRGLGPEDYAALHPRGALGWKSLFRVRDLMHTGDAVPIVRDSATMKEAIEEMNAKGLGMTTVVDAAGRLLGVITDGDLRRQQLVHGALLDRRAGDCMTPDPKRIGADELAARALALMEGVITSLVIADEGGRPAGVIHVHQGASDKAEVFRDILTRLRLKASVVAVMGDDLPDLPLMRMAGLALAPADAAAEVKRAVGWVSRFDGGRGAVREAIEMLL